MPLSFELRPAAPSDFAFCWPIYRDALQPLMAAAADWREPNERRIVELALADSGASVLRAGGVDAGWLHVEETRHVVQLRQLCLSPEKRNHGLGTAFLTWMKERAERKRKDLTVELMSNSPARRLLDRLGFKAVGTSGNKVTMRF